MVQAPLLVRLEQIYLLFLAISDVSIFGALRTRRGICVNCFMTHTNMMHSHCS